MPCDRIAGDGGGNGRALPRRLSLVLGLALVVVVMAFSGTAFAALTGLQRVHAESVSNSSDKAVGVSCPAGKQVVGAGGEIFNGAGQVALNDVIPNPALTGVTAEAHEDQNGYASNWFMRAYAICATPPPGLERVLAESAFDSINKTVLAACPAGKRLLGGGGEILSGGGQVLLEDVRLNTLMSVSVQGVEDQDGTAGNWLVRAYAICANPVAGLERVVTTTPTNSSDKGATTTCPPGKRVVGAGGEIGGGNGHVVMDDLRPSSLLGDVSAQAFEDEDGNPGNWFVRATAVCADASQRVDFDGDGFDDLAVGVAAEDIGSIEDAGAVNVIYGSASRLTADGSQIWSQSSPGIGDAAQALESFGSSLAAGDFNGDGFDDLAVGVPGEDGREGAVNVIYGSELGLTAEGNQLWHQDSAGIADADEGGDGFGGSLAAGDFNGSGHDDLAVGVAAEDVGSIENAGAVNAIYGAGVGLQATGNQLWHQDSAGIADAAEADENFGKALAAGDFNGSGHADLAVGVPGEDGREGAVNAIYGSASRLTATGNQLWHQDSAGIADAAEPGDGFGGELAAGDFNGSGHDDLAVGVPGENVGSAAAAGAVNAIYGTGVGLRATGNQLWHQDTPEIADAAEFGDLFGGSLTAGDFNGDGFDELAVGVSQEGVGAVAFAGAVNGIYGSASRLTATGNQFWHQDSTGIADPAEAFDFFGISLTAGDFNGSGRDDLAVGVLEEVVGSAAGAGAVNAIYGAGVGLRATGNQFWHQDSAGIADVAETDDEFGYALPGSD